MKEGAKKVVKVLLIAVAINAVVFAGLVIAIVFMNEERKKAGDADPSATPTITAEVSPTGEPTPTAEPTAELTPAAETGSMGDAVQPVPGMFAYEGQTRQEEGY